MASAVRRSAFQWRYAPSEPTNANTTASAPRTPVAQSRPHCHVKYWIHMPIWACGVACRCQKGGLPYCWRVSTSHKAARVVGSPSLIGGKWAARVGREKDTHQAPTPARNNPPGEAPLGARGGAADNAPPTTPGAGLHGRAAS